MPPRRSSAGKASYNSDADLAEASPRLAFDRKADQLRKELQDKRRKIKKDYDFRAEEIKIRTQTQIAAVGKKMNRSCGVGLTRLVELLERRDAVQVCIAAKLRDLQAEFETFGTYFTTGYKGLAQKAAQKPVARSMDDDGCGEQAGKDAHRAHGA